MTRKELIEELMKVGNDNSEVMIFNDEPDNFRAMDASGVKVRKLCKSYPHSSSASPMSVMIENQWIDCDSTPVNAIVLNSAEWDER